MNGDVDNIRKELYYMPNVFSLHRIYKKILINNIFFFPIKKRNIVKKKKNKKLYSRIKKKK